MERLIPFWGLLASLSRFARGLVNQCEELVDLISLPRGLMPFDFEQFEVQWIGAAEVGFIEFGVAQRQASLRVVVVCFEAGSAFR